MIDYGAHTAVRYSAPHGLCGSSDFHCGFGLASGLVLGLGLS